MALKRPILFIGDSKSEIAGIIGSVKSNPICDYENFDDIISALLMLYENYKLNMDLKDMEDYSEEWSVVNQTKKLAGFLTEITSS
jgi:hypothetical protein